MRFILLHFNAKDKISFIIRLKFSNYQYLAFIHNAAFIIILACVIDLQNIISRI